MNEHLLDGINLAAGQSALLDALIRFAASSLLYLIALHVGTMTLWELRRDRERAFRIAAAVGLSIVLTLALLMVAGSLNHETRPFISDSDTLQLVTHAADNSFPSEHAAGAAALAIIGAFGWARWRVVFLAAAFAVGIARIAAGLHYPGDVLAGWTLGAFSAWFSWTLSERIVRRAQALAGDLIPR